MSFSQKRTYEEGPDIQQAFFDISKKLTTKFLLSDTLNFAYGAFRKDIPFDRLCVALLDPQHESLTTKWVKSETAIIKGKVGYSQNIKDSSLLQLLKTRKPRIINDLLEYLHNHPLSQSTRDIITDGMRSSLTFPLISHNKPLGFIFFSSCQPHTYSEKHIDIFSKVVDLLAVVVQQAQMMEEIEQIRKLDSAWRATVHDLRSPLGVFQGYLSLVREDMPTHKLTPFTRQALEHMDSNCSYMTQLVSDLIEIYNTGKEIAAVNKTECLISDIIDSIVSSYRGTAQTKNITIRVYNPSGFHKKILFDEVKIRRVIENLLDNAVKYSNPGSEVIIRTEVKNNTVEVSVEDSGVGIEPHEMDVLFTEFGKTSSMPTAGEPSTGLGLYICKQLVEAHGGQIWVKNNPIKGCTFTFSILMELA